MSNGSKENTIGREKAICMSVRHIVPAKGWSKISERSVYARRCRKEGATLIGALSFLLATLPHYRSGVPDY